MNICPCLSVLYCKLKNIYENRFYNNQKKYSGLHELEQQQCSSFDIIHADQLEPKSDSNNLKSQLSTIEQLNSTNRFSTNFHQITQLQSISKSLNGDDVHFYLFRKKIQQIGENFQYINKEIKMDNKNIKICQFASEKTYRYLIKYQIPCLYSFYQNLHQDFHTLQSFSPLIDDYLKIQQFQSGVKLYKLTFKKFMILQPREFIYFKYGGGKDGKYWQVCVSAEDVKKSSSKVTESRLSSLSLFEQKEQQLQIRVYLQVDLQTNIKAQKVLLKALTQVNKYYQQFQYYLKDK